MAVDEKTWAAVRRAYEAGGHAVRQIARMHGVSVSALYRRAKLGGWSRGVKGDAKTPVSVKPAAAKLELPEKCLTCPDGLIEQGFFIGLKRTPTEADEGGDENAVFLKRLYNAIDLKLSRLEARMRTTSRLSCADSERETRELSSMIRSFEKVTACAADLSSKSKKREQSDGEPTKRGVADAERMRAEIAERLEKLFAKGGLGPGSCGSERE